MGSDDHPKDDEEGQGDTPEAMATAQQSAAILGELCAVITAHAEELSEVEKSCARMPNLETHINKGEEGKVLGAFSHFFALLAENSKTVLGMYLKFPELFATTGEGKLPSPEKKPPYSRQEMLALTGLHLAGDLSSRLYGTMVVAFPKALRHAYGLLEMINSYLQERFTKPEERETELQQTQIIRVMHSGEAEKSNRYVKIQLLDGNPVLTDMLIDLAERMPEYRDNVESSFVVRRAVDSLLKVAASGLLRYVERPKEFFREAGSLAEKVLEFFEKVAPLHKKFIYLPHVLVKAEDAETQQILNEGPKAETKNLAGLLAAADFQSFVQVEEDYLPANRKEKDHFGVREELLRLLYKTLRELPAVGDEKARYALAEKTVLEAARMKAEIKEILAPHDQKRLRRNIAEENDYYEGTQERGILALKRKPAPTVKMSDIVGASFDKAREEMEMLLKLANYREVVTGSAPGGKFRSNMMIIGAYGCGKTEFIKAVCADPRVIGINVSLTDVLTALMNESGNNFRRAYEQGMNIFYEDREQRQVLMAFDEVEGFFRRQQHTRDGISINGGDLESLRKTVFEVLQGMREYNGITTVFMTNDSRAIPLGVIRRFKEMYVVGQLTDKERAELLKTYVGGGLPVHAEVTDQRYAAWAVQLRDAVGDIIQKVGERIHTKYMKEFIERRPEQALMLQEHLKEKEREGLLVEGGERRNYLRARFAEVYRVVTAEEVEREVQELITRPDIAKQISVARRTYADAEKLKEILAQKNEGESNPFGLTPRELREFDEEW